MDIGISFKNLREGKARAFMPYPKRRVYRKTIFIRSRRGPRNRPLRFWKGCSTHWGVTLPEFFNEDREVLYPSAYERELIASVRKLDGEQAHVLLQLAKWLEL